MVIFTNPWLEILKTKIFDSFQSHGSGVRGLEFSESLQFISSYWDVHGRECKYSPEN